MASTKTVIPRQLVGGFNRGVEPHLLQPGEWYDLRSMRPGNGVLTQTPPVVALSGISPEVGEPSEGVALETRWLGKAIIGGLPSLVNYLWLMRETARLVTNIETGAFTRLPIIEQTTAPSYRGDNTDSILLIPLTIDSLDFGEKFYLKITGVDKFKYYVGTSAPVWSGVAENDIPAREFTTTGNLFSIYFHHLAGAEFVVDDLFVWENTGLVVDNGQAPVQTARFGLNIFIANWAGGVYRYQSFTTSLLRRVGYRPVSGRHILVYYNHLVVGGFSHDGSDSQDARYRLGWSTRDDPDDFSSYLLTSEADEYQLEQSSNYLTPVLGITGLGLLQNVVFVYTTDGIYTMEYIGLPNVMNIQRLFNFGNIFNGGLVTTPRGHYFIGVDNFYFFSGQSAPQAIGGPVKDFFFDNYLPYGDIRWDKLYGRYDPVRNEVVWTYWVLIEGLYQCRQLVYQEVENRWFYRNLPSQDVESNDLSYWTIETETRDRYLYGGALQLFRDFETGDDEDDIQNDTVAGVTAATYEIDGVLVVELDEVLIIPVAGQIQGPRLVTGDLVYGSFVYAKEVESFFLDAGWTAGQSLAVLYTVRNLLTDPLPEWKLAGYWKPTLREGRLSLPRAAGRIFRFMFIFVNDAGVVTEAKVKQWSEIVYGVEQDVEK
jgi:hypothetical protein